MRTFIANLTLALSLGVVVTTQAAVTGQWDFDGGDLSATVGTALDYRGDTAASTLFTTATIDGETANVMRFPAASLAQGYSMTHGISPNGGGAFVNQYTLIMDLMFPQAGSDVWRSLLQTSTANANDGDLFVNPGNRVGISGTYDGLILADTWHRVAFVVDLTLPADRLRKFIDGTLVGTQSLSAGIDGRWALDSTALLFTDEDQETAVGFVNSLQIHDFALPDSYIHSLGGATAAGIVVPEPGTGLLLGGGLVLLLAWRRRRNG